MPGVETSPAKLSLWRKVRRQAGIEYVRLHDLRHSFASHAVIRGVPLPVVSRLLGHRQAHMTLRYAHVGDQEVGAVAERVGVAIAMSSPTTAADHPSLSRAGLEWQHS